jgi:hypothetical protein
VRRGLGHTREPRQVAAHRLERFLLLRRHGAERAAGDHVAIAREHTDRRAQLV